MSLRVKRPDRTEPANTTRVRREWHDQLKLGMAFNVGVINEDLLHGIYRELLDKAQLLLLDEVSDPSFAFYKCQLTISPPHMLAAHYAPCTLHLQSCTMRHVPCAPAHCTRQSAFNHLDVRHGVDAVVSRHSCEVPITALPAQRVSQTLYVPPGDAGVATKTSSLAGRLVAVGGAITHPTPDPLLDEPHMPLPTHSLPLLLTNPPPSLRFFHSQGLAVCALCLATDPHDTRKCCSETFWDGSKARCRKSDEGRLITLAGTTLCSDWNNRRGCTSSSHEQCHECSSCGARIMELRGVLERRKSQALTPYKVEAWELLLRRCNLLVKYPNLTQSLQKGFDAGIQPIYFTSTPADSPSLPYFFTPRPTRRWSPRSSAKAVMSAHVPVGRSSPFSAPFSPPLCHGFKPGKPGKYWAVHNFSYPGTLTVSSINSSIKLEQRRNRDRDFNGPGASRWVT